VSIATGSAATLAAATTRARGVRPWRAAASAVPITRSAAASASGGDDARV
jgi:hypothetical protein